MSTRPTARLHTATPTLQVIDNRGLSVRSIAYHRHPDLLEVTDERITHQQYNTLGTLLSSADPRMYQAGHVNFTWYTSLTGNVLRTDSVDAGTTVLLNDIADRPLLGIDANGVTRAWRYENSELPGRPLSISEQVMDGSPRITERFVYAGNSDVEKTLNLAGQCIYHYDTAGLVQTDSIGLIDTPLSVTRCLLKEADNSDIVADWQGEDVLVWNGLLESEAYTTLTTVDASGAVLTTIDATGSVQRMAYDIAGQINGSWLTLKGGLEQVIVKSLTYSAAGQKLREEHGNGVITTYTYEPQTQRLTAIRMERPAGHASCTKVLQDLRYDYDPVGNVLSIRNDAEETRFWRNQKVVPENTYVYDTLYQLVSATGREMANIGQQGSSQPATTVPLLTDSAAFTNYTRTYTYDVAGNLTQLRHSAPATNNSYTTDITVSDCSNRAVLSSLAEKPAEVEALFDAGGNQRQLQRGQGLSWTLRGELLKVTPVVRDGREDDIESYRYDTLSQRVLKVSAQKTNTSTLTQRVLYLTGLEMRTTTSDDAKKESLQVIIMRETSRAQVRALYWTSGKPDGVINGQLRYSYDNLIGSSGLEVDGEGQVISLEEYYPYGGTAIWTTRSQIEANYKIVRYSGKERDATGLYYYGYRYYQPWIGRWLSADPAGTVDGLNLFRMVRNNPVTFIDDDGLMFRAISGGIGLGGVAYQGYQQMRKPNNSAEVTATNLPQSGSYGDNKVNTLKNKFAEKNQNFSPWDTIKKNVQGKAEALGHLAEGKVPGLNAVIKGSEIISEATQFVAFDNKLEDLNKKKLLTAAAEDTVKNFEQGVKAAVKVAAKTADATAIIFHHVKRKWRWPEKGADDEHSRFCNNKCLFRRCSIFRS